MWRAFAGVGGDDHRPVDEITEFARRYGRTKRSFIRCHHGFSRSRNGAANMHAVSCLPAVTGAWQYPGGGALYGQTAIYPLDRSLIEGLDFVDRSIRALDQSRLGAILTGDHEALAAGRRSRPCSCRTRTPRWCAPTSAACIAGLARDDLFLCVHEQFMTETAAFADIVLPATTFVEHDDFYTASGHTYFQVTQKVIDPPGECRENHEVICDARQAARREPPGLSMSAWEIMDRDAAALRDVGRRDQLAPRRAGSRPAVRDRPLPRRVRDVGPEIPLPA